MDLETAVPCVENSELPGTGQNIALYALHTARNSAFLVSAFQIHSFLPPTNLVSPITLKHMTGAVKQTFHLWFDQFCFTMISPLPTISGKNCETYWYIAECFEWHSSKEILHLSIPLRIFGIFIISCATVLLKTDVLFMQDGQVYVDCSFSCPYVSCGGSKYFCGIVVKIGDDFLFF